MLFGLKYASIHERLSSTSCDCSYKPFSVDQRLVKPEYYGRGEVLDFD